LGLSPADFKRCKRDELPRNGLALCENFIFFSVNMPAVEISVRFLAVTLLSLDTDEQA